ncbi:MAG: hypothetical protein V3W04_08710 [Gammaproteobacteria bacterium]
MNTLQSLIEQQITLENPDALNILVTDLLANHPSTVSAILFYGSCLRSLDLYDGLADLYLIVDDYSDFHSSRQQAWSNWLLPPNVFYFESIDQQQNIIRAKYAVISRKDFTKGTSRHWFHSYLWGRFTQPVALAYARDKTSREEIIHCLSNAIITFLDRCLPAIPTSGSLTDLWVHSLRLSYRAELRAESSGRASVLVDSRQEYYKTVTIAAAGELKVKLSINGESYVTTLTHRRRYLSRLSWALRIFQGKILSVCRLLKALFTFQGGLDYIAWKLERHSGQKIDIPKRVRRYPLLFIWGLFWKLYRRGVFR